MRALVGSHMVVALIVALVMVYRESAGAVLAFLYGASIGILVALLIRRSTDKALGKAIDNPKQGIVVMLSGYVLRYAVVILGLLIGLKALDLMVVFMVVGFTLVVIIQVFASLLVKS